MFVSRLSLAYKRRWPPSHGHRTSNAHSHPRPRSQRYWHFASITQTGLGGFSSSPTLLVAPLYRHPRCIAIQRTLNLLDVRPRGRNPDKLVSLH
jgi:hypothetical protein